VHGAKEQVVAVSVFVSLGRQLEVEPILSQPEGQTKGRTLED